MALKNRVNVGTYEYDGDEIKLQANFAALERLSEEKGVDALIYIQTMETIRDIVEVFYHLQFGTTYSRAEIHEAFFAELGAFNDPAIQEQLKSVIETVLGANKAALLKETEGTQKK